MRRGVDFRRLDAAEFPGGDDEDGADGRRLRVSDENLELAVGLVDVVQRVEDFRSEAMEAEVHTLETGKEETASRWEGGKVYN